MEQLTKRILAIVLIAVVGVGVGITVWIFVAPYTWGAKDCPGAPTNITEDQIIRIGVLGGLYDIQGAGQLEGAQLAAYEINQAGGIEVDGNTYYIGITAEDTDESNPNLDTTKGVAAAERIINYKNCSSQCSKLSKDHIKSLLFVLPVRCSEISALTGFFPI